MFYLGEKNAREPERSFTCRLPTGEKGGLLIDPRIKAQAVEDVEELYCPFCRRQWGTRGVILLLL